MSRGFSVGLSPFCRNSTNLASSWLVVSMRLRGRLACISLASVCALQAHAFDHSHKAFDQVLRSHVVSAGSTTAVRYKQLKAEPTILDGYLSVLSNLTTEEYETFSRDEQLSFLINAYNAFTLKLVIDHYPVESIKDIGGLFWSPWKKAFFQLFGKPTHLDNVEHDMIRKQFDEPRIHFAVNCASVGCPPLAPEAFVAKRLDAQLEKAAVGFIKNAVFNRWDGKKLHLSSIFKWYGSDFEKKHKSHIVYVASVLGLPVAAQKKADAGNLDVDYLEYDWNLNDATEP